MLCERCLAMAFTFRKPSTACQITDFDLSGYRGALRSASTRCPLYPQKRTLELSLEMSALCQKRTCRLLKAAIRVAVGEPDFVRWATRFRVAPLRLANP